MIANPVNPGLIKARYAAAMIRNAKGADRYVALKLLRSVIDDPSPTPGQSPEADQAHQETLRKVADLAEALGTALDANALWYPAERAVQKWVNLLEGRS